MVLTVRRRGTSIDPVGLCGTCAIAAQDAIQGRAILSDTKRLEFVDDGLPGISRRRQGRSWRYIDPEGRRITDRAEIDRLNAIALPPAYTDAWFAPKANCHILATGIDARGRKQYRYHPDFVAERDSRKFESCVRFGELLPKLRARVAKDLARRDLSEGRAIASVIRLLDTGRIRVGNESYARANGSFGATTLRRRHAKLHRHRLQLRFKAKSGRLCDMRVTDRGLIRFVKQVQELPGQHLFQYRDDDDVLRPITSSLVNAYIHDAMGEEFSAKHFRTWRASVLALEWLTVADDAAGLKPMLDHVAEHLGNTPAMARKAYVHPVLIEAARDADAPLAALKLPRATKWLSRHERALIALIERG